jgi:hypothetical protein
MVRKSGAGVVRQLAEGALELVELQNLGEHRLDVDRLVTLHVLVEVLVGAGSGHRRQVVGVDVGGVGR